MTGRITISPEQLKGHAKEYGRASVEISQILTKLQNLQNTLRTEWEGEAFKGFDAQFTELKPKVQNFATLMQEINKQLDSVADVMVENDLAIKGRFGLNQK